MYYKQDSILSKPIGNNTFAYTERIQHFGVAEIVIPALISGSLDDVQLGDTIAFAEMQHGAPKLFYGLKNLLHINGTNISIIDNHNHALYCRYKALHEGIIAKGLPVIHIDQHSDLGEAPSQIDRAQENDLDYIATYTNEICNVGNFIKPAIGSGLISECIQLRTEEGLLDYMQTTSSYILDVDLDFWAPEMSIKKNIATINKTRDLIAGASLVTIATSPYFMDQKKAIQLIASLLG